VVLPSRAPSKPLAEGDVVFRIMQGSRFPIVFTAEEAENGARECR
jgi:hypothetical protein